MWWVCEPGRSEILKHTFFCGSIQVSLMLLFFSYRTSTDLSSGFPELPNIGVATDFPDHLGKYGIEEITRMSSFVRTSDTILKKSETSGETSNNFLTAICNLVFSSSQISSSLSGPDRLGSCCLWNFGRSTVRLSGSLVLTI